MLTTILFDLDGTLLPMDQDVFVRSYFSRLAKKMAPYGYDPQTLIKALWAGIEAMVKNDGTVTNRDRFWAACNAVFGRDTLVDEPMFEAFYREEFQEVRADCGFDPRAAEAVREIKAMGLGAALATNPLFPPVATQSRIRWAGLQPEDFSYITTYDNSCHCKPNPDYYREILDKLHLTAQECLMVGNDTNEDLAAGRLGMEVFLLTDCLINKENKDIAQYPHGSFPELLAFIRDR